jgi:hypothetical protein
MTSWRPKLSPFHFALLILPVLFVLFAVWLWGKLVERSLAVEYDAGVFLLGLALFLTLVATGMSIYLAWSAFTMRYVVDQSHLSILYGGVAQFIPLGAITDVYAPGERVEGKKVFVRWGFGTSITPGYVVGEGRSAQLGRVVSAATTLAPGQVFVRAGSVSYGVSPRDPAGFAALLRHKRREVAGLLDDHAPSTALLGPSGWAAALWSDRLARWLLLAALVLNVFLFGYLSVVYSGLPASLPLHWNAQAQIDFIDFKQKLLRLPTYALGIWLANTLIAWLALSRERAVTLLLLAAALASQVVFWAGVLSIVLRSA